MKESYITFNEDTSFTIYCSSSIDASKSTEWGLGEDSDLKNASDVWVNISYD